MNIKTIKRQYNQGMSYDKIAQKNGITVAQLRYLIKKQKWKKRTKRKALNGNKNAKGNKGGGAPKNNKNSLKTGEYENIFKGILTEEETDIWENYTVNKVNEITNELKILLIRERRILGRIKKLQDEQKDMFIAKIEKVNNHEKTETRTTAENNNEQIQKLEESLTRLQEAKRRCIDSLHKIEMDEKTSGFGTAEQSLADTIQKAYENRINTEKDESNVK